MVPCGGTPRNIKAPLFLLIVFLLTVLACAGDGDEKASFSDDDDAPTDDDDAVADDDLVDDSTEPPSGMDLQWVDIPGGTLAMGCSVGDAECLGNEEPRHSVTLSPFQITVYEITQEEWDAVKNWNFSAFQECRECPVPPRPGRRPGILRGLRRPLAH